MTTRNVTRCYVVCDTCGVERMALAADATMARIEAAADGWSFVKYDRWANGKRQRSPRTWDACPGCPLPSTPEEALKIRAARDGESA